MHRNITTTLALIFTVVAWGLSFVAIKIVLTELSPIMYMFIRFSLASAVFLVILLIKGFPCLDRATHIKLFLTGLFEPGLYFYFETTGLTLTSASKASIILATVPLLVMVLARIFLHEPIGRNSIFAIFLSVLGIFLLVIGESGWLELNNSTIGDLLILMAALSAALYMVLARSLGNKLSSLVITSFQMFYGTIMFLPVFLFKFSATNWNTVSLNSIIALIFLALVCTVGGYSLYNYALTQIPASRASVFLNGVPVITTISAAWILGEHLAFWQLLGGLVVLLAVVFATIPHHQLPKPRQEQQPAVAP
jgi:drug/metabolite transporter (DMT)-like permease